MVEPKAFAKLDTAPSRASSGTRRMEDHIFEPVTSAFPNESAELRLWSDTNSIPHLHALDLDRTRAGSFSVCLSRDFGPTRLELGARKKPSAAG